MRILMIVMKLSKVQCVQLFGELKFSRKALGSSEVLQGSYSNTASTSTKFDLFLRHSCINVQPKIVDSGPSFHQLALVERFRDPKIIPLLV